MTTPPYSLGVVLEQVVQSVQGAVVAVRHFVRPLDGAGGVTELAVRLPARRVGRVVPGCADGTKWAQRTHRAKRTYNDNDGKQNVVLRQCTVADKVGHGLPVRAERALS